MSGEQHDLPHPTTGPAGGPSQLPLRGRGTALSLRDFSLRGRDNNFNLIRFLAAFAVLYSHSYSIVLGPAADEPFVHRIGHTLGSVAVDVFFITSGFLVTASLLRLDGFKAFFRARALRIFPALVPMAVLLACVLGAWFTTLPAGAYFAQAEVYKFLLRNTTILFGVKYNLPGVFDNLPIHTVNGSLWTLPLEVRCYLSVALLWFVAGRFAGASRFIAMVAALTLALLAGFWIAHRAGYAHEDFFRLFYMFFCGALLHALRDLIPMRHWIAALLAAALAFGVLVPASFFWIYPPVIGYLILYCAYMPGGWLRRFNRFGDYSYGIYIYAFPVQQALVASIPGITVPAMIALAGTITLVLAMLSWHLVEQRALRLKSTGGHGRAHAPMQPTIAP